MSTSRYRLRTLMIVVAIVAVDCALVPIAESLAGSLLLGLALQAGLFRWRASQGRARRFWAGFEATGLALLAGFTLCRLGHVPMFARWPWLAITGINDAAGHLPPDLLQWLLEHVLINANTPLRVIDLVVVFEVVYGLPMLLLAVASGLGTAAVRPRGAVAVAVADAGVAAREPDEDRRDQARARLGFEE